MTLAVRLAHEVTEKWITEQTEASIKYLIKLQPGDILH